MKIRSESYFVIFALLFVISCTASLFTFGLGPAPIALDAAHYWSVAESIAGGDWLQLDNQIDCRTPLYPAVLGLYRRICDTHALMAVVISQHVLNLLTNFLIAFICWRITGSRTAALACYGLCAFSLMRPWFANLVCPEPLFMFLFTASFGVLCAYHQRPRLSRSAVFGILMGLTILVRPVPKLLWIPLLGLFCIHFTKWSSTKWPARTIVGHMVAAAAAIAVVLSPWCFRNWALFDTPFVARLPAVNKWQVCFQGGSAARLSIPHTPAGKRLLDLLEAREGELSNRYCSAVIGALEKKGLSQDEIDELVSVVCCEAICAEPLGFAWPALKRFVNFWRCSPSGIPYYDEIALRAQYAGQQPWELSGLAPAYRSWLRNTPVHWLRWNEMVAALFCAGTLVMILKPRTRLIGMSLAAIFLYFAAVTSAVEVENYKYRVFLEPFMSLATVCGCLVFSADRTSTAVKPVRRPELEDTVPYGLPLRRLIAQSDVLGKESDQQSDVEHSDKYVITDEDHSDSLLRTTQQRRSYIS